MHTSKGWQLAQVLLLAVTAIATTACYMALDEQKASMAEGRSAP